MHLATISFIFVLLLGESTFASVLDYSKLNRLIYTSESLAEYPGRIHFHKIDLSKTPATSTLELISESPMRTVLVGMLMAPQPSRSAEPWMMEFLQQIEQLVFKKKNVIQMSFSKENDTQMFYAHHAITLRESDFEKYEKLSESRRFIKFIIAHEFSHFLLSNSEIRNGATPNNLVSGYFMEGFKSQDAEEDHSKKLTFDIMNPINLAHAEVDALACLILKKLGEPIPTDPMSDMREVYEVESGPIDDDSLAALELRRKVINECRAIPRSAF